MISCIENEFYHISYVKVDKQLYFRAKEVTQILEYRNTRQAVRVHVDDSDKDTYDKLLEIGGLQNSPLAYNDRKSIYINISGLFSLILGSKKQESKLFKRWITSEVLPSIMATGGYSLNNTLHIEEAPQNECINDTSLPSPSIDKANKKAAICNETDLHYAVVAFIRKRFPSIKVLASLGENQCTEQRRIDSYRKGYASGSADLTIPYQHAYYKGIAVEFKSPTGSGLLADKQLTHLQYLKDIANYKILVSNDYDYIIETLIEFFKQGRLRCQFCKTTSRNSYKTVESRARHIKFFHKNTCERTKVSIELSELCN